MFSTPPREALLHDTYELASAAARAASGRGLSKQSFALRMRIVEVGEHALRDPRIWEVHPEVSFRELAGEPIPNTKKSWHGQMRRRAVLEKTGILLPADLGSANSVAPDDVLDAAVAAWSANRIANGQARSLPHPPEEYPDARKVAIWY